MVTLIIVRRDANQTFQHVQATFAQTLGGDLAVIWDRRTSDRRLRAEPIVDRRVQDRREPESDPRFLDQRQSERRQRPEARLPDRRRVERRRRAPETWGTLGFVLVRLDRSASHRAGGEVIELPNGGA